MAKPRRTCTREFEVQTVTLVTEQGDLYAGAARQLGIRESQIHNWKARSAARGDQAFGGQGNRGKLDPEVYRLRVTTTTTR